MSSLLYFRTYVATANTSLRSPLVASKPIAQLETGISIFFFVEYILRWREQDYRPSFITEPLSLIDLVSFLPTLAVFGMAASVGLSPLSMPPSDTLSFLRLLRILRLQRFVSDFDR